MRLGGKPRGPKPGGFGRTVTQELWSKPSLFGAGVMVAALLMMSSFVGEAKASGVGSLRSGTTAGRPGGSPANDVDRVFDLRFLRAGERDVARFALGCHDFDWTLLRPAMTIDDPRKRIPISVTDASEWGAVGLAWPAPVGKIEIDDDVLDEIWFRDVVLHEVGHMVDFYFLDPQGLRDEVAEIYGAPWDEVGHSFNAAFTQAFSCFQAVDSAYPLDEAQIAELRALLGGIGPVPEKMTGVLENVRDFDQELTIPQRVQRRGNVAATTIPVI